MSDYRARVHADTLRIHALHQPAVRAPHCRACGERYPCGAARMAGRALDAFDARARRQQIIAASAGGHRPVRRDDRLDLGDVRWTRSSGCDDANRVEVAFIDDLVAVRNSAEPFGPMLLHTRAEWAAFTAAVKAGEFDDGEAVPGRPPA